jgi:hypothetical protein
MPAAFNPVVVISESGAASPERADVVAGHTDMRKGFDGWYRRR